MESRPVRVLAPVRRRVPGPLFVRLPLPASEPGSASVLPASTLTEPPPAPATIERGAEKLLEASRIPALDRTTELDGEPKAASLPTLSVPPLTETPPLNALGKASSNLPWLTVRPPRKVLVPLKVVVPSPILVTGPLPVM